MSDKLERNAILTPCATSPISIPSSPSLTSSRTMDSSIDENDLIKNSIRQPFIDKDIINTNKEGENFIASDTDALKEHTVTDKKEVITSIPIFGGGYCDTKPKQIKKKREINYLFKVVFLGKARVGKTSIFKVFRGEDFKHDSMPSVDIATYTKYITVDSKKIRVDIYDTCGQERFNALTKSYARGAQGVVLVSDFNDITTLSGAFEMYRELVDFHDTPSVVLAANKVDLANPLITKTVMGRNEHGEITKTVIKEASPIYVLNEESIVKNAKKINAIPLLVSARNGLHIKTIFYQLIRVMIARQHQLMAQEDIARSKIINVPRTLTLHDVSLDNSPKKTKKDSTCC